MATSRKRTLLALAATICLAVCVFAASANAVTFGQIGNAWGEPGFGAGQFNKPGMLGVDPVDGSVYAGDITADEKKYRIQKLTPAGESIASIALPRQAVVSGKNVTFGLHGIAVDHTRERLYLVESCRLTVEKICGKATGSFSAIRIAAFKTVPVGGALVQTGTLSLPTGEKELYGPQTIAVDPSNGDLVLFGENVEKHAVVQRISSAGVEGARFVDVGDALKGPPTGPVVRDPSKANSIAVGKDGSTYALTSAVKFEGEEAVGVLTQGWKLPPDLSKIEELPGIAAAADDEGWKSQPMGESTTFLGGPQIAIAPDGGTLYWKEESVNESTEFSIVRGFSITAGETSVIYGGGKGGRCEIESPAVVLATTGARLVAFDYTNGELGESTPGRNSILTFGPGGDGCGSPDVKFTINESSEEPVTVEQGDAVKFDASESTILGEVEKLEWAFGDGSAKVVTPGPSPALTTTHVYTTATTPGSPFTVNLKVRVKGASAPAEASATVEVVTPEPESPQAFLEVIGAPEFKVVASGTLQFDASQSWVPGDSKGPKSYRWSFGDGSAEVSTGVPIISHQFENPGGLPIPRLVTLTVESFAGATDSDMRQIEVLGTPGAPTGKEVAFEPLPELAPTPEPKEDDGGKKKSTGKQLGQEALARCRKLEPGKARRKCTNRAKAIGKKKTGNSAGRGSGS